MAEPSTMFQQLDLRELARRELGLTLAGNGMIRCPSPNHEDKNPSCQVRKGGAKCYACGASWNAIEFVMAARSCDKKTAISIIAKFTGHDADKRFIVRNLRQVTVRRKGQAPQVLDFQQAWAYRDRRGRRLYGVARFMVSEGSGQGGKSYLPYERIDEGYWLHRPKDPVILYNLPETLAAENVIVVEGEKCAEMLQQIVPENSGIAVTTWMGGANYEFGSDWSPLKGKPVILWPDNDKPGKKAMLNLATMLMETQGCTDVTLVSPHESWPKKADVSDLIDEGWDWRRIAAYLLENLVRHDPEAHKESGDRGEKPDLLGDNPHFRVLGYVPSDRGIAAILYLKRTRNVFALGSAETTPKMLVDLAPRMFWEMHYADASDKGAFTPRMVLAIREALIAVATDIGLFDADLVRAKGWHWVGPKKTRRAVLNTGEVLWCDGKQMPLDSIDDGHYWIRAKPTDWGPLDEPCDENVRAELWSLVSSVKWTVPQMAYPVAGWLALAPVCGLLRFRPSLWMRGESGMGKSFVDELFRTLLGKTLEYISGGSSEAGIRRQLRYNSNAIVLDENESESQKERDSVDEVMKLMRICSGTGGRVIKADLSSPEGVLSYEMRTMMMFSSVTRRQLAQASESRIMYVELEIPKGMSVKDFKKHALTKVTPAAEFILSDDRVSPRYLHWVREHVHDLLGAVRQGIEQVRASERGMFRFDDLYGTLVGAGVYIATGRRAGAAEMAQIVDALEESPSGQQPAKDHELLLRAILSRRLEVHQDMYSRRPQRAGLGGGGDSLYEDEAGREKRKPASRTFSHYALLNRANGHEVPGLPITREAARIVLSHAGIAMPARKNSAVPENHLGIALDFPEINRGLRNTRWAGSSYGEILRRTVGTAVVRRARIADGRVSIVLVPYSAVPELEMPMREPGDDRDDDADAPAADEDDIPF